MNTYTRNNTVLVTEKYMNPIMFPEELCYKALRWEVYDKHNNAL